MYATDLGLDREAFARCLTERRFARDVGADVAQGRALGITGTPTFLVNGRTLVGAQSAEAFRTVIDEALRRRRSSGGTRSATASPGRDERWGLGGHVGAPMSLNRAWGPCRGPHVNQCPS